MALGYGTKVATPGGGEAAIERIVDGDQILVAGLAGGVPSWSGAAVIYSQGADRFRGMASYLKFEGDSELVCTLGQPLLRADGRMVRAQHLAPGDRLLAPDGTSREIIFHGVDRWDGGVRGIALAGDWNGRPDGHLIGVAGVIAGDWLAELGLG